MNRRLRLAAVAGCLLHLLSCRGEREMAGARPEASPGPAKTARAAERATPAVTAPASSSVAAPALEEQRLEASDGEPFDHLGYSVATDGEVVVAGARFADVAGEDSGAAYVFRRSPSGWWHQEAKLVPRDPFTQDRFGNAVALDGDTLVVGAPAHHELGRKVGSAYVFRYQRGTWRQETKLTAPEAPRFGQTVGVSGDRIVVGAPGALVDGSLAGAVYVFHRQGSSWRREARLTAGDAREGHLFGIAAGISGNTLAVGASGDDARGSLTGAAYVFRYDGGRWQQEAKLLADDASALAELGKAIAIDGDTVVVGADGAGDTGKFSGAAYVFRRQGKVWHQEARLLASDRKAADRFGNAVALHLDRIAVGAHFADPAGLNSGAAYVFHRSQERWSEESKLVPKGGAAGEEFGNAVALQGAVVAIGALRGGSRGTGAGAVSVFAPAAGTSSTGGSP